MRVVAVVGSFGLGLLAALSGCSAQPSATAPDPAPGATLPTTPYEIAASPTPGESWTPVALGQGIDALSGAALRGCVAAPVEDLGGSVGYLSGGPLDDLAVLALLQPDDQPGRRPADLPAAARRFAQELAPAQLSSAATFGLGDYELVLEGLSLAYGAATAVAPDGPDFTTRCGDRFASRRTRGGQLLLLIRRDFLDQAAAWDCRSVGGHALGALEAAESYLACAGRMAVHVAALQRGGDPERLSTRLRPAGSGLTASLWSRDCPASDVRPCRDFVRQVVDYAGTSGPAGFTSGLEQAPADLRRTLQAWTIIGMPGHAPRVVPDAIWAARRALQALRSGQEAIAERLRLVQAGLFGTSPGLEARLPGVAAAVAGNLALLEAAEGRCWEQFTDPADPAKVAACADGASAAALAVAGYDATLTLDDLRLAPEPAR